MGRKYFPNDTVVEVDYNSLAGVGGAAVVVNLNRNKVAKIERIKITGDKEEAERVAKKTEFITIKRTVEIMKNKWKDYSMILQPEVVFVQKIEDTWYLVTGKINAL